MAKFDIGDIVVRKSYGKDIYFTVAGIRQDELRNTEYVLKGVFYRIEADAHEEDLLKEDVRNVELNLESGAYESKEKCFNKSSCKQKLFRKNIWNIPFEKNTGNNFAH